MNNHKKIFTDTDAFLTQSTLVSEDPQCDNVIFLQEISNSGLPLQQDVNNLQEQGFHGQFLVPVEQLRENKVSTNRVQMLPAEYLIVRDNGSEKSYPITDALQNLSSNRVMSINPLQISTQRNKLNISRKIKAKTCNPIKQKIPLVVEKEIKGDLRTEQTQTSTKSAEEPDVPIVRIKKTPLLRRLNTKYVWIHDREVPPRAVAVLPPALQYRRGDVFPYPRALPQTVRFGPVKGICKKIPTDVALKLVNESAAAQTPVFLLSHDDGSVTSINMSDKDKSNWLGLLPLGDSRTANVWLEQDGDQLYAVTTNSILTRTSLKLGYSKTYAEIYHMPDSAPVMDLNELAQWPSEWWCNECSKAMPSLVEFERHSEWHIKDEHIKNGVPPHQRRKHPCRFCTQRFTKLSSLKRHLQLTCAKKKLLIDQTPEMKPTEPETPADETRLPSDESLQNYTNILDISTSLFDTDRMPNLDISGSTKSENEFSAFNIKDDVILPSDFAFPPDPMVRLGSPEKKPAIRKRSTIVSSSPITCPHCKADMPRSKLKQHARVCASRRFVCKCGTVFRTKHKLALHAMARHTPKEELETYDKVKIGVKTEKESEEMEKDGQQYECKACGIVFKRRGMYVNHLSRRHGTPAAPVPLLVRDNRYPCPVCPKLYRAAAKRDRHVMQHHPGTKYKRLVIEGGSRAKDPSLCWACPKQYASRAKLLQHARMMHPNEVLPADYKKLLKSK